jgi:hypothetical protein
MNFLSLKFSILFFTLCSIQFSFSQEEKKLNEDKNIKFVPIPYVSFNRTYKFMAGAVPMVMYKINKKDTISPSSLSGVMGVYTTNETWFTAVFSKLYLKED